MKTKLTEIKKIVNSPLTMNEIAFLKTYKKDKKISLFRKWFELFIGYGPKNDRNMSNF